MATNGKNGNGKNGNGKSGNGKSGNGTTSADWTTAKRWLGVMRPYSAEDVARISGSVRVEHTLARMGAERLWDLLQNESHVTALGAMTGNQAIQEVAAGLDAIYLSGWQVAADANVAGQEMQTWRAGVLVQRNAVLSQRLWQFALSLVVLAKELMGLDGIRRQPPYALESPTGQVL